MGVLGERMTEESYATLSWNQPPVKFKKKKQRRKYIFHIHINIHERKAFPCERRMRVEIK